MRINLVKTSMGLKPIDDEDIRKLKKIEEGEIVVAEYKLARNYRFHRKLFALLDLMYSNDCLELTKERYRKEMLICCGHFDTYNSYDGSVVREAKSISFASMDEDSFNSLYQDMLQVACLRLKVDEGTITEELKYTLGKFF
jgi:hypothetical protein